MNLFCLSGRQTYEAEHEMAINLDSGLSGLADEPSENGIFRDGNRLCR